METQIADPTEEYRVSPEALEIAKTYLGCFDVSVTAQALGVDSEKVAYYLRKPEIKRFIDTHFMEQGYMNRNKIQEVMDKVLELKIEEMEESEMGSNKDIIDILQLQHKMRMDYLKEAKEAEPITKQQINIGDSAVAEMGSNYNGLLGKLMQAQK